MHHLYQEISHPIISSDIIDITGIIVPQKNLDKRNKKRNWLGNFWKSCIFYPSNAGIAVEETHAGERGGNEGWRKRRVSD